ncbi:MAG: 23S rRNA (pseudouridine(1915)-N(3))-methyltransferase RlmH [Bacteroidetes bacterium]|jgi:23S rRNA (pseudouridine1915-N3)-methyltransferase|nr:23S rRNA (pseudouridine(1915)-N(3))-methyltransferase RlmH [Bacteroidota bacterium]MBS1926512.1 23S rRNA (pseudouridine(1915)-N(3))-methyltransferase RlmH [Bacteroidota bacterium]
MKIQLWSIGKAHESYVKEGIELFTKRLNNYFSADWKIIPSPKNAAGLEPEELKTKEEEIILAQLKKDDYLILLDERGKLLNNMALANFIQQRANDSTKTCIFLIGGAYGVSKGIQQRANFTWSLSSLVFPHQLARLILAEQLYRCCSILKNEKYHH